MTPENFVHWLKGYDELAGLNTPNSEQWLKIRDKLAQVSPVTPRLTITPEGTPRTVNVDNFHQYVPHQAEPSCGFRIKA